MRSGMCMLAVCSLFGWALSAGTAQDRLYESHSSEYGIPKSPARNIQYFPRAGRSSESDRPVSRIAEGPNNQEGIETVSGIRSDRSYGQKQLPSRYVRNPETYGNRAKATMDDRDNLPPVKNYYRELFGANRPKQPGATAQNRRETRGENSYDRLGVESRRRFRGNEAFSRQPAFPETNSHVTSGREPLRSGSESAYRRNPFEPRQTIVADTELPPSTDSNRSPLGPSGPRDRIENKQPPIADPASRNFTNSDRFRFSNSLRTNASTAQPPTSDREPSESGKLIYAEYKRRADLAKQNEIRQVRATEARPNDPQTIDSNLSRFWDADQSKFGSKNHGSRLQADRSTERFGHSSHSQSRTSIRPTGSTFSTPSPGPQTPTVTLRWIKRSEVNVGQEFRCELRVRNNGKIAANDIVVEAYFPASVRLTSVEPSPIEKSDYLSWKFASLGAGEEQTIAVRMIPSERGELAMTSFVRFTGAATGLFTVEEPLLEVTIQGPTEVMLGDPASQIVTVSNPGNGTAYNVQIEALLPEGLEHPRGERLVMEIGALNPGESRTIRLALAAVAGGQHQLRVLVQADNGLRRQIDSAVTVIAPSLKVSLDGPGLRYKGRSAKYLVTVTNDGTAVSNNVRLVYNVPEGFKFTSADHGGKFDSTSSSVNWFLGRLEVGQTSEINVELIASELGDSVHTASAYSEHGTRSEAQTRTRVEGTASLVLEILDLDDPVEIGTETAYEVRVRNEGSKAARNVGLSCELPVGVELIGAKGPVDFIAENGLIVFKSLSELAAGKTAIYRISVRGTIEGNQRFRARLASDSIREPLIFEELTRFYRD